MSALKVLRRGYCNDCKQLHGRMPDANVALCFSCKDSRRRDRDKTEQYLEYGRRYNRSAHGKLKKAEWEEGHPRIYKSRVLQRTHKCESWGCSNIFIRVRSSHRMFCDPCALAFFGSRYIRRRNKRVAKYLAA